MENLLAEGGKTMAKGKLEFDLPEETSEFKRAVNALAVVCVLDEIKNYCRNQIKHCEHSDETIKILEEIQSIAWEIPDED